MYKYGKEKIAKNRYTIEYIENKRKYQEVHL